MKGQSFQYIISRQRFQFLANPSNKVEIINIKALVQGRLRLFAAQTFTGRRTAAWNEPRSRGTDKSRTFEVRRDTLCQLIIRVFPVTWHSAINIEYSVQLRTL